MSSNLHKFTVEEALNAQSIHSGKWIVHPMRTWVDKDPNNVNTTGFLDVSDTTLISVQCGDFMCISFQKGPSHGKTTHFVLSNTVGLKSTLYSELFLSTNVTVLTLFVMG